MDDQNYLRNALKIISGYKDSELTSFNSYKIHKLSLWVELNIDTYGWNNTTVSFNIMSG